MFNLLCNVFSFFIYAIITIIESGNINEIYNINGDFEQSNLDTIKKLLTLYNVSESEIENHIDFSCNRPGQDVRYALDDSKIKALGWSPNKLFNDEIGSIVNYYKHKFIW